MINKLIYAVSDYNRLRKFNFFMKYFRPGPEVRVLDVGASNQETQKNANIIEKKYPYPNKLTALGIIEFTQDEFKKRYPEVKTVTYDGRRFPFGDEEFDICWSNAVIEHVRDGADRELFLKEIRRVSKAAFITTPNRFFPFETHTKLPLLHWLPKRIFDNMLGRIGMGWATGDYMTLMGKRDIKRLLERCGIRHYTIKSNRFLGFTMDFAVIFSNTDMER